MLDNRLVPFAAGTATLTVSYGSSRNISVAVSVQDTYLATWPRAAGATDTTVYIAANMTGDYTVMFRAVPSNQLDLVGAPPSASDVEGSGAVTLVADTEHGANFYGATASGLSPGTNYTLLLAVRSGVTLSSGVTALSGMLIPDTQPPTFTSARLVGEASNTTVGGFTVSLDLGLNEAGTVAFAVYGDPDCLTGRWGYLRGGLDRVCKQQSSLHVDARSKPAHCIKSPPTTTTNR